MPGNITQGLSSDRNYEVGMMTEGNIPGKKNRKKPSQYCVYCRGISNSHEIRKGKG